MKPLFDLDKSRCKKDAVEVVSKDKGNPVKHILYNKSGFPIYQWHIDGDIDKSETEDKCDYLVEIHKTSIIAFFPIEFKGKSQLNHALVQLETTINKYNLNRKGYEIYPRVVMKGVSTHGILGSNCRKFKNKYPNLRIDSGLSQDTVWYVLLIT